MKKKNQSLKSLSVESGTHSSHEEVRKRLKRAAGHLNKVISMIEENEKCIDISMQLHAVVKALVEAKKTIIHDHIEHCLSEENLNVNDLKEFKEIAKYL